MIRRPRACATCGKPTHRHALREIAPPRMAALATHGFGETVPNLAVVPAGQRAEIFRQFVAAYRQPWLLCPDCQALADALPMPPAPPAMPRPGLLARLAASRIAGFLLKAGGVVAVLAGVAVVREHGDDAQFWWQSRDAIATARARVRAGDFPAARDALQQAIVAYPSNPRLIARMADLLELMRQPHIAGIYVRALAALEGAPTRRFHALQHRADNLAAATRVRARHIFDQAYALHAALPPARASGDAPAFHPYEALFIPPAHARGPMVPYYTRDGLDQGWVICTARCGGGFRSVPWAEILRAETLRIDRPTDGARPPCCALSLRDPVLADPVGAVRGIEELPSAYQVRDLFNLAARLAFLANMNSFNDPYNLNRFSGTLQND